jgi:phage terminase large subunit-like protein
MVLELLLGPNGPSVFEPPEAAAAVWLGMRDKLSPAFAAQWFAAGNPKTFAETAHQYARDIVSGAIPACIYVRQACQRHLDDLARIPDPAWPYRFDDTKADRVCRFIELLPHVKGNWASRDERIQLEPWQIFSLACVFGWVKKAASGPAASGGLRRFSLVYEEVSRKNAKSTKVAGVGCYMLACDGEFGAEVYSGATTLDQALEVFRPARQMLERSPELKAILGVTPAIKKIEMAEDGSRFEPVIGKPGDGASPTCGIVDEYHEHDSDELFDTIRTGMGAREQPLEWVITTAGTNTASPCKLLQGDIIKILDGTVKREEVFGIIYTIDADDDWASDIALVKCNPNIDVSVFRDFLVTERDAALANPRKQGIFKTKHLCIWGGALAAYFDARKFAALGDPALDIAAFQGMTCACSIDLSTKRDITARVFMFKRIIAGKNHYYIFPRFYIPAEQVLKPENQHFQGWVKEGYLIQHAGAVIDFELVKIEAVSGIREYKAREFVFDPWNAAGFAQSIQKETRAEIIELQQSTSKLSGPMKEMDALIAEGRLHHDGNPVLVWMVGNVNAKEDANENVFPRKEEGREENKIDGAVACMMVLSRLMIGGAKRSVYATRGVLTIGPPTAAAEKTDTVAV